MLRLNDHNAVDTDKLDLNLRHHYLSIFAVLPLICLARYCCECVGRFIFLSSDAAKCLREKPKALKLAAKKFEEATWKATYYGTMALYGLLFLSWEPYLVDHTAVYPNPVNWKISLYYMVQISFYIWMTVCILWGDVRMKDFYQMTLHHIVTLVLLFVSYSWHITHCGSLLLLLMDIADPFLELGKISKYLGSETYSTVAFVVFFLSFIILRLFVYPVLALYPCIYYTWDLALYLQAQHIYYIVIGFMWVLFALNLYWAGLILKVIIAKFTEGKMRDVRSDDEMD